MNRRKSHDESVIEMIRSDPEFAVEYLRMALKELDTNGGQANFLTALRHFFEALCSIAEKAEKAGLSSESLNRALSPKGNPTLRTLRQVVHGTWSASTSIT